MGPRARAGVSTFLEVFILVGVAFGGSSIAYGATGALSRSLQGPSLSVTGATISQGLDAAVERLTVYNSGSTAAGSFTVATTGVASSAQFCYSALNPVTKSIALSTCPTLSTNPTSVLFSTSLQPGASMVVELDLSGAPFVVGSSYPVTVSTRAGAQQTVEVEAVPA